MMLTMFRSSNANSHELKERMPAVERDCTELKALVNKISQLPVLTSNFPGQEQFVVEYPKRGVVPTGNQDVENTRKDERPQQTATSFAQMASAAAAVDGGWSTVGPKHRRL